MNKKRLTLLLLCATVLLWLGVTFLVRGVNTAITALSKNDKEQDASAMSAQFKPYTKFTLPYNMTSVYYNEDGFIVDKHEITYMLRHKGEFNDELLNHLLNTISPWYDGVIVHISNRCYAKFDNILWRIKHTEQDSLITVIIYKKELDYENIRRGTRWNSERGSPGDPGRDL